MGIDQRPGCGSRTVFFMLTVAAVGILPAADAISQTPPAPASAATPAAADLLKAEELDQLVAPIALYPDALLSNVLMAATYPLEVDRGGSLGEGQQEPEG